MWIGGIMFFNRTFKGILKEWKSPIWDSKVEVTNIRPADQLKSDLLNCCIRYDHDTQLEALTSIVKKQFPLTWRVYRLHIIRNRKQESVAA